MPSFNDLCVNTLPDGVYKAQVTDINLKVSKNSDTSNDLVVHYTIVEGPLAKKTLIDTIFEKTFSWRLKPFLEACGLDMNKEFATSKELFNYGLSTAKGKIIMIEVGTRMYNGTKYNNVTGFSALPGSTTTADEVADIVKDLNIPTATDTIVLSKEMNSPEIVDEPKLEFNMDDEGEDFY